MTQCCPKTGVCYPFKGSPEMAIVLTLGNAPTRQNWGVTNYGGGGPRIWDIPYYHLARITSYSRHYDAIRIFWYIAIVIHGD